jgi:asparagine synthase (glutamine-hydrolysing)
MVTMCGIAGFLSVHAGESAEELTVMAARMADTLSHRGPDDAGTWVDAQAGVALGFRRLAIIDLTAAGRQPMISHSGRYVLCFNGEIYNYLDLRADLTSAKVRFRGSSDTEVLLAAIECWGLEVALERTNGMFALALWDRASRTLSLARDRVGEKPLYYGVAGDTLLFASELKALRAHPRFAAVLDPDAAALYFRHGWIPTPHCIYQGVKKLPPGTYVKTTPGQSTRFEEPRHYWSFVEHALAGAAASHSSLSLAESVDVVEELLADSIRMRMIADVPLGAFLSGGVDSSTVVALMRKGTPAPVKTFTIGFEEAGYDEAAHARVIASHLGTDHTEWYVSVDDALDVIPDLPSVYDEPFADSSQIPTMLVSRLARQHVAVALSGDGGDELFGGYDRYSLYERMVGRILRVPGPVRSTAARMLLSLPSGRWDDVLRALSPLLPRVLRRNEVGAQLHRLATALRADNHSAFYRSLMSHWEDPTALVHGATEPGTVFTSDLAARFVSPRLQAMALDTLCYLPDDILTKVDRAAMAVSLETRLPLLDHRLVELAWRLSPLARPVDGRSKAVLRELLDRHVPPRLSDRPKMGFGVPIGIWLRTSLREWADELLSREALNAHALLDVSRVRALWHRHLSGDIDAKYLIWDVLMFQAWLRHTGPLGRRMRSRSSPNGRQASS